MQFVNKVIINYFQNKRKLNNNKRKQNRFKLNINNNKRKLNKCIVNY